MISTVLLVLFVLLSILNEIAAMPYRVPLQGNLAGLRTLVLLDEMAIKLTHSTFFDDLAKRGHEITYYSSELNLKKFGEYLFDNIVLFAPKEEEFVTIGTEDLREFADYGGNIMFMAGEAMSEKMRLFAATCGVDFDKKGSQVIDHFYNHPLIDSNFANTAILSQQYTQNAAILGEFAKDNTNKAILFRGVGHAVDKSNVLGTTVLVGNPTTYSADLLSNTDDFPENIGSDTILVSAMQARNNARLVFAGSIELFANEFFTANPANREFANELSKWNFGESGVLRFRDVTHHKVDGTPPDVILHEKERPDLPTTLYPDPEITRNSLVYRIKDDIVYSMIVEEFSNGKWHPFKADDMQMEFVMLDPYIRKTMVSDAVGKFSATFTAPDSYGIFKFRVLYRRQGYSVLHAETQVSIRPFKHNEYERFIVSAYPYYASAISSVVGFFILSVCFIFSSDK